MIDVSAGANTRSVYYGISQGGIMGGALMAPTRIPTTGCSACRE